MKARSLAEIENLKVGDSVRWSRPDSEGYVYEVKGVSEGVATLFWRGKEETFPWELAHTERYGFWEKV